MSTLVVNQVNSSKGAAIASQTTLPAEFWTSGQLVPVSGTATITGITTAPSSGVMRTILAEGAFTLTDNGSTLRVFGGTQTVAAGDLIDVYATEITSFYCRIHGIGKKEIDTARATAINAGTFDANTVSGYGIGVTKTLANGYDLDTLIANGLYTVYDPHTDVTIPSDNRTWLVEVNCKDSTTGYQRIHCAAVYLTYERFLESSTWGPWLPVWNSNSDGNGGQPPAPKPQASPSTADGPGQEYQGSVTDATVYAAGAAPKSGTWHYSWLTLTSATGVVVAAKTGVGLASGSASQAIASTETCIFDCWRTQ